MMVKDLELFLNECRSKRVVVIGECVRDIFVNTKRLSGPAEYEFTITKELIREEFAGGAYPVARDLSSFVHDVKFVTCATHSFPMNEERLTILPMSRKCISKTRFYSGQKDNIFHYHCEFSEDPTLSLVPLQKLIPVLTDADLVIVLDYGHGLLDSSMREMLSAHSKFVALNCQANEDGYPFHQIWKYERADLLLLNRGESEISLMKSGLQVKALAEQLHNRFSAAHTIVTDAENGAVIQGKNGAHSSPALSNAVVDTVGCGDIMLGFAALAAQGGRSSEEILRIASIAAGAKTRINVHERPLSHDDMYEIILGVRNAT